MIGLKVCSLFESDLIVASSAVARLQVKANAREGK